MNEEKRFSREIKLRTCLLNVDYNGHNVNSKMVSVTVSSASKSIPVARGLPETLEISGTSVTVADVKTHLARKYPKVGLIC